MAVFHPNCPRRRRERWTDGVSQGGMAVGWGYGVGARGLATGIADGLNRGLLAIGIDDGDGTLNAPHL